MIRKLCATALLLALACCSIVIAVEPVPKALHTLPVLMNGRVQPLDSVGRQTLISLREKSSYTRIVDGQSYEVPPALWLWQLMNHDPKIDHDKVFLIHDPDIKHELQLNSEAKFFSFNDLKPHVFNLQAKAQNISSRQERSVYERNTLQLAQKLQLFIALQHTLIPFSDRSFDDYIQAYFRRVKKGLELFNRYNKGQSLSSEADQLALLEFNQDFKRHRQFVDLSIMYLYPDWKEEELQWANTGQELLKSLDYDHEPSFVLLQYAKMSKAFKSADSAAFAKHVSDLNKSLHEVSGINAFKLKIEYLFHSLKPFYWAIVLYVCAFILQLIAYLKESMPLQWTVRNLTYIAFYLHSLGMLLHMYIQGRPPVTNLYTSAVFVGWTGIGLSLLLEKLYKQRWGYSAASCLGVITLIVAHHLALQSDTLEQMQAVLDSNFWLSTHVITITLGYGGTFLAGMLASFYVLRNAWKSQKKTDQRQLHAMVYGIICFSLFFSFVGTVLGGIWADQSWGRFWGWDPKENGALLIVIWNAMILHAHLGKYIKTRGLMLMAILGNIVTAFSWFGVNMLGVGLHSYGFMDSAFQWLLFYSATQLALVVLGRLKH